MDKVAELLVWMGDGQMTVAQKDDRERYIEIYREELEAENPDIDDIRVEEWGALAILLYPSQKTDVIKAYDGEVPGPSPRYPDLKMKLLKEIRLTDKEDVCTCHERDSTYTCPKCHSEGTYGHGEEPTDTHYECEACGSWTPKEAACVFCTTPEPTVKSFLTVQGTKGFLKKSELPQHLVDILKEWGHYQDGKYGTYIDVPSEFAPDYGSLMTGGLEEWHKDMKAGGHVACETLEDFVKQWGLQFEVWLIENCGSQLKGIEEILIEMEE